ncbi:alpha-2-macroglobulin family protein [uncultured Desulfuromonas sp.]|uniref:alpha-2-macroglobulin family protein n=1 Tax=uncultured Desulfuromonas sp. TaxID=181013 RepID=UPI002AABCCB3|nr:alpha-2-macroglobulin family protein [uncultured Desulfuromonas sp.]
MFLSLNSALATGPSFDCSKASHYVERVICRSDELSQLDLELATLYKKVMKKLPDDVKKDVKQEQLEWLKKRNKDCSLPGKEAEKCLAEYYRQRNEELSAMLAFDSARKPSNKQLKLLRVTPKGNDVPAGQQLVFQFDRPVVPIGRMERQSSEIPVTITPQLACEWRWLNTSALACQLTEANKMKPATRYEVVMRPGLRTENGAGLKSTIHHSFITSRPQVTYTRFVNWLTPGTPLIQVTFNLPVTKNSVEKSLSMFARKVPGSQPMGVVAYPDDMPRELPWWQTAAEVSEQTVNDQKIALPDDEARTVWLIEPRQELPADQTIWLDVQPGLRSPEGAESGVESRTIVRFETYPAFKFKGIRCTLKGERYAKDITLEELLQPADEQTEIRQCTPLNPVALVFSAPVLESSVRDHVAFSPRLDGDRNDYDPWENTLDRTRLTRPHRKGRVYQLWLPELLQANQNYRVTIDSNHFTDEFGRQLKQNIEFSFVTSHREPDLRVTHRYAVLEKEVDSDIPLYVTNLDQVKVSFDKLGDTVSGNMLNHDIAVPEAKDIAFALPMGVRTLLGDDSGIIYAHLHPDPRPPKWNFDPALLAQVTPFQVHFKAGHFNSQAWVTSFADGQPVTGAKVSLFKGSYDNLPELEPLGLVATTNTDGIADLPGLSEFDPDLKFIYGGSRADRPGFFAKVEFDDDIALVPLNNDFSVRGSGAYPNLKKKGGHSRAWGTTAQGIYKLGDTVQYKIYLRNQSNKHWVAPQKDSYNLQVFDPQNKIVHQQKGIDLNEFGAYDGEFTVPAQGTVGWYKFKLSPIKNQQERRARFTWTPMSVLISDFTPAPFKVKTDLNGDLFTAKDQVEATSLASMHSGGPFSKAEIRLTAKLTQKPFTTNNPQTAGFVFGSSSGRYLTSEQQNLLDIRGTLDDLGQYKNAFQLPEAGIYFGSVLVESAVKDERGKFVTSVAKADYAGRNRFVGLKNTRWVYKKGQPATIEAVVVNAAGELQPGVEISLTVNHREYKASRVKGPGNAYLTKNIMSWVEESRCTLTSDAAVTRCEFTPLHPGFYKFIATIKDEQNREHQTTINGWVTGRGSVVWDQTNDATLQIVPEQTKYKIGDTARYLIKNPFPGAKALVTIERYGIVDSWVETLDSSTPVIEVPIKPDYLPGFYLSVVVVSPRVEQPLGPGKVDLGKPSYRMGYVQARVVDPFKEIPITVSTDKQIYKPRETVKAKIRIDPSRTGKQEPYEIAVAVVDESVLALNRDGDNYYDPYAGFNHLDALDVYNYSLISRLVGRQKFEKKGANPGGDGNEGGSPYSTLRNMFKFVSYWNPTIRPDQDGNAEIEFEVPDNLTGWRIFAFAVTPDDQMGLGDTNFKVNRPTEIRPVMPNQVIEGDRFKAGFNIKNRTDKSRQLKLKVAVEGPLADKKKALFEFDLPIAPYERKNIWLPLSTKGSGELIFVAQGGDQLDGDAIEHRLPVNKRRSLETAATYGTTTADTISESVKIPEGIHTDVGYLGAVLSPSVIGNLDGAFRYIKEYPHMCWEQRLTKAVVANSYLELKDYLDKSTEWPNAQHDVVKALRVAANFQAPNGGMTYWRPQNSYVSPYLSAYTAMAFNWLKRNHHEVPSKVEERLHAYLLKLLRRDELPTFYSKGMAASVRAVALAALAEAGKITAADVLRHEPHLPEMDLFGKAHFLQAAIKTPEVPDAVLTTTLDAILGHASQSGGKFQFNEPWDDSYKYILATPLRSNCAILSSLLTAQTKAEQGETIGDIPFKLVRSITQSRGNRDYWENTQENLYCLNALIDYASIYERSDPNMTIAVDFDGEALGKAEFSCKADPQVEVTRPLTVNDPGRQAKIVMEKEGTGRFYYSARIAYDLKEENAARINSGIEIRREYSIERDGKFVLLKSPMEIRRGDLVKVDLFVSVPTARHFVVVEDKVPGGLEPVNTDLATASTVDADKAKFKAADGSWFYTFSDWSYYGRYFWSFYHKELKHDAARFYADYLPAGNYRLSYAAQAIAEGQFIVPAVFVEEMYDPDVYGKGLPATLQVTE